MEVIPSSNQSLGWESLRGAFFTHTDAVKSNVSTHFCRSFKSGPVFIELLKTSVKNKTLYQATYSY